MIIYFKTEMIQRIKSEPHNLQELYESLLLMHLLQRFLTERIDDKGRHSATMGVSRGVFGGSRPPGFGRGVVGGLRGGSWAGFGKHYSVLCTESTLENV